MPDSQELIEEVFHQRLTAHALRHQVFQYHDPWKALDLQTLIQTEEALGQAEKALEHALKNSALPGGVILQSPENMNILGPDTTNLAAKSTLKMAQIPTSIYHLLNAKEDPLIDCWVRNYASETRRLRVSSFIEGYSATAVDTFELQNGGEKTIPLLPTLFPEPARTLNELTRATLNVMIEEIDGQVELHRTTPVWLLARTNVPLAVQDPTDGSWRDLTRYLGAFVTPNALPVMAFLRKATLYHTEGRFIGYQGSKDKVEPQIKAIFDALKQEASLTYVNSVVGFSPDQGSFTQRVRLPRESLTDGQANCIDGTVLMASLLEAISLNPAIVVIPGHAFLGWETWRGSDAWRYLETTMIGTNTFEEACQSAEKTAKAYQELVAKTGKLHFFRRWSLRELRTKHYIFPME